MDKPFATRDEITRFKLNDNLLGPLYFRLRGTGKVSARAGVSSRSKMTLKGHRRGEFSHRKIAATPASAGSNLLLCSCSGQPG
jgi:hypothetical protein